LSEVALEVAFVSDDPEIDIDAGGESRATDLTTL
jgi:hypothetical protein